LQLTPYHQYVQLGLTVSNLRATAGFFTEGLGYTVARELPDYPAIFVTNGSSFLTLWQAKAAAPTAFDRTQNVGLHHFALKVSTEKALNEAFEKASKIEGTVVEFRPQLMGDGPAKHCMMFEPSGIRIEFFFAPE
jgi:catechol-2,3-dioxygenase